MATITGYQGQIIRLESQIQALARQLGEQLKSEILSQTLQSAQAVCAKTLQQTADGDDEISTELEEIEALIQQKAKEYQAIKWSYIHENGYPYEYVNAIDFANFKRQLEVYAMTVLHHEHFVLTQVGNGLQFMPLKPISQSLHLNPAFDSATMEHIRRLGGRV